MDKKLGTCIIKNNGITLNYTENNSLGTLRFNTYSKSLEYSDTKKWNTVIQKVDNTNNIMLVSHSSREESEKNIIVGNNNDTDKIILNSISLGSNIEPNSNSINFGNNLNKHLTFKNNIIFGRDSLSKNENNIIFGNNNIVHKDTILIGNNHNIESLNSVILGCNVIRNHKYLNESISIGFNNQNSLNYSTIIGCSVNKKNNEYDTIIGKNTNILGIKNVIVGLNDNIYSNSAVIIGNNTLVQKDNIVNLSNININNDHINLGYKHKSSENYNNSISIGYLSSNFSNNISLGYKSGENVFNEKNILIGTNTGQNCITNNLIFGNKNGRFLGKNNTLFGENLCKHNTGNNNTLVGYDICQLNSSNNTIIGYSNASLISGSNNIIIGNNNINNNKTYLNNCITLGYYCLKTKSNQYNNIFEIRNKQKYILGNINTNTLDIQGNIAIKNIKIKSESSLTFESNYDLIKLNNISIKHSIIALKHITFNNIIKVSENNISYYIDKNHTFVLVLGKNVTLVLPEISDNIGRIYNIKQFNLNTSNIITSNNNLINGKKTYTIKSQNSTIKLFPLKNEWIILDIYDGNNKTRFKNLLD